MTAPFISLDGNTLVFTSDYADENELLIYYTERVQVNWKEPQALPRHINNKLNFAGGYSLSADGKSIYITSIKSGGIGGYDIWTGDLKGNSWGDLQNMFIPINSKLHEGCPTFTPDGGTMYFMRCETMNQQKADKCKIMVSVQENGRWQEPKELPANINTGNSQTPRISSDGRILIFASNTMRPNKRDMDLYASRMVNGSWTNPIALDFVNTDQDDQFVSFIANGRYLVKDAPGKFKREIVEYLIPEEWRPGAVIKVEGVITDMNDAPTPAYISVTDLATQARVFTGRPDKDGSYFLFLPEGTRYELSIDPEKGNYTYVSKIIDMTVAGNPLILKLNAVLKPIHEGDEFDLEGIRFKANSAELEKENAELRRLSRLLKSSPELDYELHVSFIGYEENQMPVNPDLTEVSVDSVLFQIDEVDSLGQTHSRDSLVVETMYHNNRTEKQATAIIDELTALGVDRSRLSYTVSMVPEPELENRKTKVKLVARKKADADPSIRK